MAVPTTAYVDQSLHTQLQQTIETRLRRGKEHWRPLHARMDRWMGMYLLQDIIQQSKPAGYRRFISNEPRTAVDLAISILTRNDSFWRIALFEQAGENAEMRRFIGNVERLLQGVVYDLDEMFSMRLQPRMWKQAAASALLRGQIWGKIHVTTEAQKYRETPIMADFYDPRLVIPHVDAFGLNYVLVESSTTLGDLVNMYPEQFGHRERDANYDPYSPASKIEYWSNDRGDKKGVTAVLAAETVTDNSIVYDIGGETGAVSNACWVIKPYYHGYDPASLPIIGVPVNGLNLKVRPEMTGLLLDGMNRNAEILGAQSPYNWWYGQNSYVSETGRSILASVEEHVPQYNELIATILQHLGLSAFGTWTFTSPTGELPRFKPGIEAQIPLTPEERLERVEIGPMNSDAYKLVDILGAEKQNGMLSNILRANDFSGNGVLFQQMANAALNALEPYQDGMEEFGQRWGRSFLAQVQQAAPILKPFEVATPGSASSTKRQSYWIVEFDPKELAKQKRKLRPRPVFKPALPDDLAVRINAARLALDPRRPILSLTTVLEHILQVEDPTDEIDRIWEDIASNDPVIVLEQIGMALERLGETELAKRISEKEFRTAFAEEAAFRQQTGGAIPAPGQMPNMPPEAGGGEFNTQTSESMGGGGMEGASVGSAMGSMGERGSV